MARKGLTLPARTDWVDVVPGADPPENVLLVLLQELDEGSYNLFIGIWDKEIGVFLNTEGHAVETMGKVTKYHILVSPANKRFAVLYDEG